MKKSTAVELYHLICAQIPANSKVIRIYPVIEAQDDTLVIGLDIKYHIPDEFPELDGIWPVNGRQRWTLKGMGDPCKLFTYKELVKIYNIWEERVNKDGLERLE